MFCSSCGTQINVKANFCPKCGARLNKPAAENTSAPYGSLPQGMTYAGKNIYWECQVKREVNRFYMNEEKVALLFEPPKPKSKGKAFALEALDFADAFGAGDSMYSELPSEIFASGSASEFPSSYQYMISIKGDRAHNRIKVFAEGSPQYIYFTTPEQYDFAYNFITSRCPRAKIK